MLPSDRIAELSYAPRPWVADPSLPKDAARKPTETQVAVSADWSLIEAGDVPLIKRKPDSLSDTA